MTTYHPAVRTGSHPLVINNLRVEYRVRGSWLPVIQNFSLTLPEGQFYGLAGESGSGKSTVAKAVMGDLGENGRISAGEILFYGRSLVGLSKQELRGIWGKALSLVPQDTLAALNPSLTIGEQMADGLSHQRSLAKKAALLEARSLLQTVQMPEPEQALARYPHQLSGGMRQRVLIAMALGGGAQVLIMDEPTSSLDVTTQAAILQTLKDHSLQRRDQSQNLSGLYISHDLGVVAQMCTRLAVLYAGEQVEDAGVLDVLKSPRHPYTRALLDSIPTSQKHKHTTPLAGIPGNAPGLLEREYDAGGEPMGCIFAPRCPYQDELCQAERPKVEFLPEGRSLRCHHWQTTVKTQAAPSAPPISQDQEDALQPGEPVLRASSLSVVFTSSNLLNKLLRRASQPPVRAVNDVDLSLHKQKTVGLVGESGSGKTTIARSLVGLEPATNGTIELSGEPLPASLARRQRDTLAKIQMIFQSLQESLHPYQTIEQILTRPLQTLLGQTPQAARQQIPALLRSVNLPEDLARRKPDQLSGGERQRVAIARAIITAPLLLIADEAVSALDVSVQATVLNLMLEVQAKQKNALLFISHDLSVIAYLADEVAVMYQGKILEYTPAQRIFQAPHHPYTEMLLSVIPRLDHILEPAQISTFEPGSDLPKVVNGCPFVGRCRYQLPNLCERSFPPWQTTPGGKQIACHVPLADLLSFQGEGQRP